MSTRRDMTGAQFDAALEKHGIYATSLGYYNVGGLHVHAQNGGRTRRGQLAYLLQAQHKNQVRRARVEALQAERDALIGARGVGEHVGLTVDGRTFKLTLEKLTAVECAAVVLALRAARGAP